MNKMDTTTTVIIGVLSSLIASFLFWIIVPLIKKLGISTINLFARRSKKFRDSIYKRAAKRKTNHNLDQGVLLISILTFSILSWAVLSENLSFESSLLNKRFEKIFFYATAAFIVLTFYLRMTTREKIMDLVQDFNNDIELLTPFVAKDIIFNLKRSWILMNDYEDYQLLSRRINDLKNQQPT